MQKFLLACLLASPFALVHAQPAPTPAPSAQEEKETELDEKMNAMRSPFNKLRKQISDPAANPSSLELAAKLRKAAEEALALSPARATEVPEADRAKFREAYQSKMKAFIAETQKLEAALQAGNNADATASLAKLGAMQKDGHKEFRRSKPQG